ncbi:HPF/RaiA family ribosome-associated protein [Massilia scottii]|uniref:HPF/RaiA family ribosome-associated protein n=1 Tax=Massilia scottii TaxID=3057166 RepID=UPI00279696AF|nr:HPF/RaiA family ribosome-associated protein [Massilia sp. CCM 9029]MDQ1832773.1 HPF/RaiA family ribosome-associated protein [Massilia sp. CCM 9029]
MRVTIQANGFVLTEALRSYTEQRLAIALGWAGQHMRKLAVSLSDINGPRGGIDKRCKIQVQLGGGKEVIIEDTEADLYSAIDRAAERADRAVVRQVERKRDFTHTRLPANRPSDMGTADDDMRDRDDDAAS